MMSKNIFGQEAEPMDVALTNLKAAILNTREAKLFIRFIEWICDHLEKVLNK